MKHLLVVATHNRGKLDELRSFLEGLPVEVVALAELAPTAPPVVEDGRTFAENALKKARAAADLTMAMALADDSGLEVDVLDGAPGVRSARFAHERATDAENNAALIAALVAQGDPTGAAARGFRARFRCALALIDPYTHGSAEHVVVEGMCEGHIVPTPRGPGGFGYDPLFVVAGGKTLAELSPAEKNAISHRGRAFDALRPELEDILQRREAQIAAALG